VERHGTEDARGRLEQAVLQQAALQPVAPMEQVIEALRKVFCIVFSEREKRKRVALYSVMR
jgi:hypothetical protein